VALPTSTTPAPAVGTETRTAPPAEAALALPTVPVGVTGTANFGGDILAESNNALLYQQAYGTAGTREWGEWEGLVRTNPWVAAGLDFIVSPIRDARIDVEEAPESEQPDRAAAAAHAEYLRWAFSTGGSTLTDFLVSAVRGMLGTGFAVFEPTFRKAVNATLPGGEGWTLARLAERLPNTLAYNAWVEDAEGRDLIAIKQNGPRGQEWWSGLVPAERLLLFTWQRAGNNYAGFSAFRAVWYLAKIQAELLRLVGVTYQREGAGIPVAQATDYNAPLSAEQRKALQQTLSGAVYHEAAAVVMPAGWSIEWVFSGGANKGHVLDAWRQLGIVILQQVQAQQLVLGTSDTGSRSVGAVHDASAMAFVQSVIAQLEAVINGVPGRAYTGLVQRLVRAQFGAGVTAFPRVKLQPPRAQLSPDVRLAAVRDAVVAKVLTPTLDVENAVREVLGFEPISEEDRKAHAPAVPSPFMPFRPAAGAGQEDASSVGTSRASNPPPLSASAPRGPWTPRRPLRASEERTDWGGLDAYLTEAREEFEKEARGLVVQMLAKAASDITAAMEDGNPDEVATLPLDTAGLDSLVAQYLDAARDFGKRTATAEIQRGTGEDIAEKRADGIDTLRAAAGDDIEGEADEVLEAQRRQAVRRMVSRLRLELEDEAIDVLRVGGDASEVVARTVANQLETGAFRSDAGLLTAKAVNVGRDEAARLMGGVSEVEYSALLDSETCEPCQQMDGRRATFNSSEHDAMVPPNRDCEGGARCRCVLLYLRGEE
jgi:hypothetical protein